MTIEFSSNICESSKVIVPISMGSDLTGQKLKVLIEALQRKKCDITILIADTLQKYNVDYDIALGMGDVFIEDNKETLKNLKKFRWHEYISVKTEDFKSKVIAIEANSKPESKFYIQMLSTQDKCAISNNVENSLLYQKEEYAVYLTFSEFDYHVYPKAISDGMAWLYREFPTIKKPLYVHAEISGIKPEKIPFTNFFKPSDKKKSEQSLPLVLRLLSKRFTAILNYPELLAEQKKFFLAIIDEKLQNINAYGQNENNSFLESKLFLTDFEATLKSPEIAPTAKKNFSDAMRNLVIIEEFKLANDYKFILR